MESITTVTSQSNMIGDFTEEGYFSKQESARSTFSPNADINDQLHMAEFQRAIDRLRLRRQSSASSQSIQTHEGSRKNSIVRDLLQGQNHKAAANFSSTCASPVSSNGKRLTLNHELYSFIFLFDC